MPPVTNATRLDDMTIPSRWPVGGLRRRAPDALRFELAGLLSGFKANTQHLQCKRKVRAVQIEGCDGFACHVGSPDVKKRSACAK
jgi:hypothetical protein